MKFIGITGGVGAGKSTVLNYLKDNCRARIMMADEIAHDLMEPGGACYLAIRRLFEGTDCFAEDGSLLRNRMAQVIFSDETKRNKLNAIVHPAVKRYIIKEYQKEKVADTYEYLVLEAALLIEEGYDKICDELWYIYTSEANRRKRLMESRGYSEEKVASIFDSQLPEEEYRRHCVAVIDNNGTETETIECLKKVLKERSSQ